MTKKIILVSLFLVSVMILSLVLAGENKHDTPPPADPNQSSVKEDKSNSQPSTSSPQEQPAEANDISNNGPDQTELPAESPIPSFYASCRAVFDLCVNDNGDVDYSLLRRKRSDLLNALKILETVHPAQIMVMEDDEKQAFWINVYNICTLKLIIDNYPIEPKWYMIIYPKNSIMQISNPWTKNYFKIQGLEYNLQEIERELLLERFGDPRICFALNNATRGGAILRKELYQSNLLDTQLTEQVRKYLTSTRGLRWDNEKKILYISNLFNMHRATFLKSKYAEIKKFRQRKDEERVWLNFIFTFVTEEQAKLLENSEYTLQFIDYDWNLNDSSSQ